MMKKLVVITLFMFAIAKVDAQQADTTRYRLVSQSTIVANQKPLVLLNDKPYYGEINKIKPDYLSAIGVIPSAMATAVYGSSAANGAIMIYTEPEGKGVKRLIYDARMLVDNTLIVVDGNIFIGPVNRIKPGKISSVDLLSKDTALEIYGAGEKRSVLLITTKKK